MKKRLIYLADLTHTGAGIASNVFPLAIGLVASYVQEIYQEKYGIELFKYPDDLNQALKRETPDIVGFSNYSWNCHLSYQFAKAIKEQFPQTIVVFGGPNYGLTDPEVREFWSRFPRLDFYLVKEGELAFVKLLEQLERYGFDAPALKNSDECISNAHYVGENGLTKGEVLPRLADLQVLGSPYLKGFMDKFFDSVLIPMIHTTRGCPFTCTFCTEGNLYYNKVAQRLDLKEELEYIAQRRKGVQDLLITDANFGMYAEDIAKAQVIHKVQEKYDWPRRIIVSTGKNKKERIIEVASIVGGALSFAASLQSTNKEILKNISRQNISLEVLNEIVEKAQHIGTTTYTELILCLPGDTLQTHLQSLKDVVDSNLDNIRMYQLILLPQTEMNTPQSRQIYGFITKFRINPRSFGRYEVLNRNVASIESEEIVVANNTLSAGDYLMCREMDFTVEVVHNTQLFTELCGLCKYFRISWFDFLLRFYQKARQPNSGLQELYDTFKTDTLRGLWASWQVLEEASESLIDGLLFDSEGTNEMAKGKALAFFRYFSQINELVSGEFKTYLDDQRLGNGCLALYLEQLKQLNYARKQDFLEITSQRKALSLNFDFEQLARCNYRADPQTYFSAQPLMLEIYHDHRQIEKIDAYVQQYGKKVDGLGRIMMRAPVGKLFRTMKTRTYSLSRG